LGEAGGEALEVPWTRKAAEKRGKKLGKWWENGGKMVGKWSP
jgi:hypothetical protein